MKPLISVVVPVYRVQEYLSRCVLSLQSQTYPNLEIILVDDGSPDRCGEMCDTFAAQDARIRTIHQTNRGLSAARNAGTMDAKGEYIAFVDSDDWVHPEYVERLWELAERTGAELTVCGNQKVSAEKDVTADEVENRFFCLNRQDALAEMLYQGRIETNAWGKLYLTRHAKKCLYPEGRLFEDLATTYRFFAMAEKIAVCDAALYYYWQRPDSIMARKFEPSRFDELVSADEMYHFIQMRFPEQEPAACCRRFSCYCQVLLMLPTEENYRQKRREIWTVLKNSRLRVLKDPRARRKNRIAALLAYGGEWMLRLGWMIHSEKME